MGPSDLPSVRLAISVDYKTTNSELYCPLQMGFAAQHVKEAGMTCIKRDQGLSEADKKSRQAEVPANGFLTLPLVQIDTSLQPDALI